MLGCPRCGAPLAPRCPGCGAAWTQTEDGIWDLYLPAAEAGEDTAVTTTVRAFYEERPFPDYDADADVGALLRAGRANAFTRALDAELSPTARIVEFGCGTAQMSLFLGIVGRPVLGVDLSLASLRAGETFRRRAGLGSVQLVRGNLFRPPVIPGSADVVVSNGVLHHTGDARRGFASLVRACRPGGFVIVGLYNRFGRFLLPLLRSRHRQALEGGGARAAAWFHDQHVHPHETRHTADEVLGWLAAEGVDFVSAHPPLALGASPGPVFQPADPGTRLSRLLAQLSWLSRAADGGLWVTVGRRRP